MKKARIYISIAFAGISLLLAIFDLLALPKREKPTKAKSPARNPTGNIDSLAKARAVKAQKAKEREEELANESFRDLEELNLTVRDEEKN